MLLGTSGFADCDSAYANGCEISLLLDANNCGSCGSICSQSGAAWPQVATWGCAAGKCSIASCNEGYFNCDGLTSNGCESLIPCCSVAANCTVRNWVQVASYTCLNSLCGIATCNANYDNCDSNVLNGCETNLLTTASACSSCAVNCNNPPASATAASVCSSGNCAVQSCPALFSSPLCLTR
jgi:hypothetical protein